MKVQHSALAGIVIMLGVLPAGAGWPGEGIGSAFGETMTVEKLRAVAAEGIQNGLQNFGNNSVPLQQIASSFTSFATGFTPDPDKAPLAIVGKSAATVLGDKHIIAADQASMNLGVYIFFAAAFLGIVCLLNTCLRACLLGR
mmetsp:Transcript_13946/g.42183  ORF Transcript_13946/g.42183 Transcript_13946/m.42183 type:complete len:142 (+) Transcript_13946:45-470(+)